MSGKGQIGKREIRIPIGECPWCGAERVPLRDYLCYNNMDVCCHEVFRGLPGKAAVAMREFPGSRIEGEDDLGKYLLKFYEVYTQDKRQVEKYGGHLEVVSAFQEEYDGHLSDFFNFLIRLYVARGYIEMKGAILDMLLHDCLVCGKELPETSKHELCSSCMESVGQPEGEFSTERPGAEPEKPKPRGMVFHDR